MAQTELSRVGPSDVYGAIITEDRYATTGSLVWIVAFLNFSCIGLIYIGGGDTVFSLARTGVLLLYIHLVPGYLLYTLLGLDQPLSEAIPYWVGLSIISLGTLGVLISTFLPKIGISAPLAAPNLMWGLVLLTSVLCIKIHTSNRDLVIPSLNFKNKRVFLFLLLLPVAAISAVLVSRSYPTVMPQLIVIVLVVTLPLLVELNLLPERLYPLAIYVGGLSLLYITVLHIPYLTGRDSHWEYYFARTTYEQLYWNPNISFKASVMLGISVIRPAIAILTGLPLLDMYKWTPALIYALFPVCAYHLNRKKFGPRISIYATFFIIFFWGFFLKTAETHRQQLALLFTGLLLVSIYSSQSNSENRNKYLYLCIVFLIGIITSHYGVTFLIASLLFIVGAVAIVIIRVNNRVGWFSDVPQGYPVLLIPLLGVMAFTWYSVVGNGILLNQVSRILGYILLDFLAIDVSTSASGGGSAARWVTRDLYSISYEIFRLMNFILVPFVLIGFINEVWKLFRQRTLSNLYTILFTGAAGLLFLVMFLFPSANPIDLPRIFHLMLIWFGPFTILGVRTLVHIVGKKASWISGSTYRGVVITLLVLYLLYGSGFVPAVTGEFQYNNALTVRENLEDPRALVDNADIKIEDYHSAVWLGEYRNQQASVYTDFTSIHIVAYSEVPRFDHWASGKSGTRKRLSPENPSVPSESYIYIRTLVLKDGIYPGNVGNAKYGEGEYYTDSDNVITPVRKQYSLVYTSGGTNIFINNT